MSNEQPTRIHYEHVVRRCTSEKQAAEELDKAYAHGYKLLAPPVGGGTDGNVLWLIFQRSRQEAMSTSPAIPQGVEPPLGGSFGS